jgi:hypothetical protein
MKAKASRMTTDDDESITEDDESNIMTPCLKRKRSGITQDDFDAFNGYLVVALLTAGTDPRCSDQQLLVAIAVEHRQRMQWSALRAAWITATV